MIQNYKTIDLVGGLYAHYPAHTLPVYRRAAKPPARQTAYRPRRRIIAAVLLALATALLFAYVASAAPPPPPKRHPCPAGYALTRKVKMWGAMPVVYYVCMYRAVK